MGGTDLEQRHSAVAIIPCTDLDASEAFYEMLGFAAVSRYEIHGYRILKDGEGASIHLARVAPGWLTPERNAHGLYLYAENVEDLARKLGCAVELKPWGLREFALSDPDGTLVRVGW